MTLGVVDSDYRGEVISILVNNGNSPFHFTKGDKIAQLVIIKMSTMTLEEVDSLDNTIRGRGWFGSKDKLPAIPKACKAAPKPTKPEYIPNCKWNKITYASS